MPNDFKKLMSARFCFTLAVQMQAIVLGWSMYDLTKDALFLGLIGLVEALPALGLAIFAGYIVDRSRPLVVYQRIVFISLVSALILLATHSFEFEDKQKIVLLFSSSFLTGCARSFSQPSMFSLVPKLIPKHLLSLSSTWMTSAMQTARMTGPALGGVLFGFTSAKFTALVISFFLFLTILILKNLSYNGPANRPTKGLSIKHELLSGARFVFSHPILFPAMSLDMIAVLFGGVTALLPIYAAEILQVGPSGLGVLRASPAIGAFLMSALLLKVDVKTKSGVKLFWSVAGFGLSILIFAVSSHFVLSLMALFFSGAFDSVSMVIRTSLVQLLSPDDMRGRISAVNSIFIGSSNEIGEFESGVTVKLMGLIPAAVFGAVMCLSTVTIISMSCTSLRKLNLSDLEN